MGKPAPFSGQAEVVGRAGWEGSDGNVSAIKGNGKPPSGTAGRHTENYNERLRPENTGQKKER